MNKKLLVVAIAGALAAPGVALADGSTVTISGIMKMGYGQYKISGGTVNRSNRSQDMVVDNSSRIIFGVNEDLGNGLAAIGQIDIRYQPDGGALAGSGNDFVGLKSKSWGQLVLGRLDLHYSATPDDTAAKAGALHAAAVSLMDFMPDGKGVNTSIANGTRTPNVIAFDTINFNGFAARIAYSSEPFTGENDMTVAAATTGTRKGSAWNFRPEYNNGPIKVGYTYWDAKPDAPTATSLDQRGDTFYGSYLFGNGFKVGLAYNRSRLDYSLGGVKSAERNAWSLPMSYAWGPHTIVGHYTKADDIKSGLVVPGSTGANMFAIAYNYDLSKRTALGITYAKINNDTNAAYAFFTSTGTLGSGNLAPFAGEDPQFVQAVVRHAF